VTKRKPKVVGLNFKEAVRVAIEAIDELEGCLYGEWSADLDDINVEARDVLKAWLERWEK